MNADSKKYSCGLLPGDRIRLKKDLVVHDHMQRPTGEVHGIGEVWTVLEDSCSSQHDLWLKQPDGAPHTWSDDDSVFEYFELV